MFDRTKALATVAALSLTALSSSTAMAGSANRSDAVYVPAVIGAAYNDTSRADSVFDVRRQGGFATAGTMLWLAHAPEARTSKNEVESQVIYLPSVIGAMNEGHSLARSADDVARQGGFATAGTVRWLAHAIDAQTVAAF